jgi:hypothetical protein
MSAAIYSNVGSIQHLHKFFDATLLLLGVTAVSASGGTTDCMHACLHSHKTREEWQDDRGQRQQERP